METVNSRLRYGHFCDNYSRLAKAQLDTVISSVKLQQLLSVRDCFDARKLILTGSGIGFAVAQSLFGLFTHKSDIMFGVELKDRQDIIFYGKKLHEMGAQNVLISMAGDGAILIDEYGKVHKCGVCKGVVKNSVGAGDSMVAGFIAGSEKGDYEYALKLGTATGGATAFSEGLAKKEDIFTLLKQL